MCHSNVFFNGAKQPESQLGFFFFFDLEENQLVFILLIKTRGLDKTVDSIQEQVSWASLVAQWLRICLLMQGTRVRALVWEDPTCHGAAGPVSHNC